jgi:hypothetical protein
MLRERHLGQAVDLSSFELAGVRDSGGVDVILLNIVVKIL